MSEDFDILDVNSESLKEGGADVKIRFSMPEDHGIDFFSEHVDYESAAFNELDDGNFEFQLAVDDNPVVKSTLREISKIKQLSEREAEQSNYAKLSYIRRLFSVLDAMWH